jgi:hypothetical protein
MSIFFKFTTLQLVFNIKRINRQTPWSFGTICDDLWSEAEAQVVCRMLHFQWGIVSFRKYNKYAMICSLENREKDGYFAKSTPLTVHQRIKVSVCWSFWCWKLIVVLLSYFYPPCRWAITSYQSYSNTWNKTKYIWLIIPILWNDLR